MERSFKCFYVLTLLASFCELSSAFQAPINDPALPTTGRVVRPYATQPEYRRTLSEAALAQTPDSTLDVVNVSIGRSLGMQDSKPIAVDVTLCASDNVRTSIQSGILGILKTAGYEITFPGFSPNGLLKATRLTHGTLFSSPALYEELTLYVKVDLPGASNDIILLIYELRTGALKSDTRSWTDQTESPAAAKYISDLSFRIKDLSDASLKMECRKVTSGQQTDQQQALRALATKLSSNQAMKVTSSMSKP
jgi:hypothetical protein